MGANAQTTVQKFVDGAVLTAAQQNFSAATGIPVFASTVTRDAAFGGANKALAEGQTCYLEDANVVQYYDGAAWASVGEVSKVVQIVNVQTGAMATGTTIIPADATIPQITEGDQYMSLAITPQNASNILTIEVVMIYATLNAGYSTSALFVGATANALAAAIIGSAAGNQPETTGFRHRMVAGVTTALTFTVRNGMGGATTTTFNGAQGINLAGGVLASSITITESTP